MANRPAVHGYWEAGGASKDFTHALDRELLAAYVPRDARVLDYGCGYGRLTAQLAALGYGHVRGVDPSLAMVVRGRREHPGLDLAHQSTLPLPRADGHADGSYDAALLFVVLNCVPGDADQRAIVRELARLVRPGGVLYVSDVPVQRDARNISRYEQHAADTAHAPEAAPYGVFTTPDGGLFRHHPPGHVRELLHTYGFTVEEERTGSSATLHGHTTDHVQTIARRARGG